MSAWAAAIVAALAALAGWLWGRRRPVPMKDVQAAAGERLDAVARTSTEAVKDAEDEHAKAIERIDVAATEEVRRLGADHGALRERLRERLRAALRRDGGA